MTDLAPRRTILLGHLNRQIAAVCDETPRTAYELARELGVSQGAVTRAIAGLCDHGVLRRHARSRAYELSPDWVDAVTRVVATEEAAAAAASVSGTPGPVSKRVPTAAGLDLFYSYSHQDAAHRREFETHLSLLRRQGAVRGWSDLQIFPGDDWKVEIADHLRSADIIVLLVSAAFLASDYCYDVEMEAALRRHEQGTARVIPILVKPVDWESSPFGKLQALPPGAKPVVEWKSRDRAWTEVVRGIRRITDRFTSG